MIAIRAATPDDLPAICAILNAVIAGSTASFATRAVDLASRQAWFANRVEAGLPVLVAIQAGTDTVTGFASYGPFRAGAGYDQTVEHTVHVGAAFRGQGTGRQLLAAVVAHAAAAGRHVMVGAIDAGNTASLALHAQAGFVRTGHLPQVGAKFGGWLDLVLVQLQLNDAALPPGAAP
jgi:L-amino acid N-acyltransferase